MRRTAGPVALALAMATLLPGTAQARQGEEELQVTNGSILFLTRFTDGDGGFPGLGRRLYQHAHELNGILAYVLPVDRETWRGRFTVDVDSQQNPPGDADLGVFLYSDLADGGNSAPTTTAEYDVRAPGGEKGFIPVDTTHAIVFMTRGLQVSFTYKGYSPMSVEVAEAGFAPAEVTVGTGGYVVWENVGEDFHSATADGGAFDSSPTPRKPIIPGAQFAVQFTEVGDLTYFDRYGEATGVVHVVPGPGAGTPAE